MGISKNKPLMEAYFLQLGRPRQERRTQEVLFSLDVLKHCDKTGLAQKRVIVITNEAVSILRRNELSQALVLRRRVPHRELRALTKSLSNQYEFLIQPLTQPDVRLLSDQREALMQCLKECFARWSPKPLPVFGAPDAKAVEDACTTKIQFRQYLQKPLPDDSVSLQAVTFQLRLADEELKAEEFDPRDAMAQIQE